MISCVVKADYHNEDAKTNYVTYYIWMYPIVMLLLLFTLRSIYNIGFCSWYMV